MNPFRLDFRCFAGVPAITPILALFLMTPARASEPPSFEEAERHWAFRMPERARVPPVDAGDRTGWITNPIDAFVADKQRNAGLQPSRPAPKPVLLRRVFLDLTGLPPTPEELHRFLSDPSPDAYEKVVDGLLNSPRYGERWGRHWMDVWRYSDAYGDEGKGRLTNGLPHLWRWRDWIIESLNADKGYDRMILEMLAGDEIAPADSDVLRATGYLVRNRFRLDRNVPLMASVEHTGRAFLGLTLECARCHEHKDDPVSQEDYYRFRAFFEPIGFRVDHVQGEPNTGKDGLARVYDADLEMPTYLFAKGDERRPVEEQPLKPGIPAFFEAVFLDARGLAFEEIALAPEQYYPWLQPQLIREESNRLQSEVERLEAVVRKQSSILNRAQLDPVAIESEAATEARTKLPVAELELATARARLAATVACRDADQLKYASLQIRDPAESARFETLALAADAAQKAARIAAAEENIFKTRERIAELKKNNEDNSQIGKIQTAEKELVEHQAQLEEIGKSKPATDYEPLGEVYPGKTSGRRTALARWLGGDRNPLTARVAVNHIWMRHFGEPLVATVSDFGHAGTPPSHPELLDWLAVEFVESGWRMKALHRLMVTSATYRMNSSNKGNETNRAVDPGNRFLWRMHPQRMQAEAVRDSILYLARMLDSAMGGPEIPLEREPDPHRRSIYYQHTGAAQIPLLEVFDGANVLECYRREESIAPQQALALSNSELARIAARRIAAELSESSPNPAGFVTAAFEHVLARAPSQAEAVASERFLGEQAQRLREPSRLTPFLGKNTSALPPATDPLQRARESLVLVLFNHNDYVTVR